MSSPLSPEEELNPYSAPQAPLVAEAGLGHGPGLANDEVIRRRYLNHETNIKSVGSLHILGAVLIAFGLIAVGVALVNRAEGGPISPFGVIAAGFYLILFFVNVTVGVGLHRLRPWARWAEVAVCCLSLTLQAVSILLVLVTAGTRAMGALIGGSLGWVIPGCILYLMLSSKAGVVFSPEYQGVIARTPHVKYKTSCLAKMILVAFVVLVAGLFVIALSRR